MGTVNVDGQKTIWLQQLERLPRLRFRPAFVTFAAPEEGFVLTRLRELGVPVHSAPLLIHPADGGIGEDGWRISLRTYALFSVCLSVLGALSFSCAPLSVTNPPGAAPRPFLSFTPALTLCSVMKINMNMNLFALCLKLILKPYYLTLHLYFLPYTLVTHENSHSVRAAH